MSRRHEIARGTLALGGLLALLAGVPLLLAVTVGWPLPRALPHPSHLLDTTAGDRPLETATVWKVLAVVVWLAWAQLLAATATETVALTRGGLPRTLPAMPAAQGMAASLVATVALLWPGGALPRAHGHPSSPLPPPASAPVTAAPASDADPPDPQPAHPDTTTPRSTPRFTEHVVERKDTLWGLAERYLGDGRRATELFELNRGRPQPDGGSLREPRLLRPGWMLQIPVPPGHHEEPAASGAETAEVVVEPGDTLWDLAAQQLGDGHRYPEVFDRNVGRTQPDGEVLTDPDHIEPGWRLAMPTPPTATEPDTAVSEPDPGPPPPPSPPTASETTAAPSPATEPHSTIADRDTVSAADDTEDEAGGTHGVVGLIGGGIATAGALAALGRRRRVQQRNRTRGRRPRELPPVLDRAERRLRSGADPDGAALLDAVLRAAAASGTMPPLRWIEIGTDTVVLSFADHAAAPAGFAAEGPQRWRTAVTPEKLAALGAAACSPAPALAPVGRTAEGSEILIDLEAAGGVTVAGGVDASRGFLRSVALAAATSAWADSPRVVVVGLGHDIGSLPGIQMTDSLDSALDDLEQRVERTRTALERLGCDTTAEARARGAAPGSLEPLIAFNAVPPTPDQAKRLAVLARQPHHAVAAVTVPPPTREVIGLELTIAHDGVVQINDGPQIEARRFDEEDTHALAELFDAADAPPDAVAAQTDTRPAPRSAAAGVGDSPLGELLNEVDVLVGVLGEVDAKRLTPDGEEPLTVAKQKALEAICYLALREGPVDREDLQAALWPDGTNSPKTLHNTIWAARRGLGHSRDGDDLFPEPTGARYQLSERVVTNYGLFHELAARAGELDHGPERARLLTDALTLVRGEPFLGVGRGYAWVAPHAGIIVAELVDVAEELAGMHLASGDWRRAEWAARQGLRAFPCEERLYRVLMRAAHTSGSIPAVLRVFEELLARLADPDDGVEPDETVHPETIALLEELTGSNHRQAGL